MPFDGEISAEKSAKNFLEELPADASEGHRRLARLVDDLRRPLPLRWDFELVHVRSPCGTAGCALGVEMELRHGGKHPLQFWTQYFDLHERLVGHFFSLPAYESGPGTTPLEVAARIDGWLRERYDV